MKATQHTSEHKSAAKPAAGSFFAPAIQAKLTVNQAGDSHEREADSVAERVVQRLASPELSAAKPENLPLQRAIKPAASIQPKAAPGADDDLQRKEEEEKPVQEKIQRKPIFDSAAEPPEDGEGGGVQRKPDTGSWGTLQLKCAECAAEDAKKVQREPADGAGGPTPAPAELGSQLHSSKGGGAPLPDDTRSQMEGAFGADFSNVRVHTGSNAAQMSDSIQAHAFTHGSDIYFNSGQYDPGSTDGKKLLAHELTHTVQQGAVVRPKLDIAKGATPPIQRGAWEWIKNKIKQGLNWAAERVIPGYSLLNVILGKNLITDEPVERSGVNIVRAYMRLVPFIGSILLSELEETETLPQAGAWTEQQVKKFGINFDDIAKRLEAMWDEMSAWRGVDYNVEIFKRYIGPVLFKFLAFSSVMQDKMKELRLEGALRLVGATELLNVLKNDPAAFKRVVENPSIILSNFMDALKKGFSQFKDNFGTHFKNALFGWLLGKAAEMGIQMPKEFSIAGVFSLVAQLAGLTYGQIKALVIEKLGPQMGPKAAKVFRYIETTVEILIKVVPRLMSEGPIALWELVKEQLNNLKEMVLGQITELVITEVIKSAVTKLLSMLNPAGALVQLVLTLYRVIKFFIDNWATIKEIAVGILNSVTKVALGQLGEAANFVERILAKGVQLIISFLARIFGLSGIADKVKGLIKKFGGLLIKARDWAVNWLVEKGKALYERFFGKKGDKKDKGKGGFEGVTAEIRSEGDEKKKDGEIKKDEADQIAQKVQIDQSDVVKSITVKDAGEKWRFEYVQKSNNDHSDLPKKESKNRKEIEKYLGKVAPLDPPPGYEYYDKKNDGSFSIRRLPGKVDEGYVKLSIEEVRVDGDVQNPGFENHIIENENEGHTSNRISVPGRLTTALGGRKANHQAHHVIPDAVVRDHNLMKIARQDIGYNLDEEHNGLMMPCNEEGLKQTPIAIHMGSHPNYNAAVTEHLDLEKAALESSNIQPEQRISKLRSIVSRTEEKYRKIAKNSTPKLN